MHKIIIILFLFFAFSSQAKINSTFKAFTSFGLASIPNEIKKNRSELVFNLGINYEFFCYSKWSISLNSSLSTTKNLSSGSNNTYVKPTFYGTNNDIMATYKILGERIAFLPSLGIATRLGLTHVRKKIINHYDSHAYVLYGFGPKFSLGYQIINIGFNIAYSFELGKQNLRQELASAISYSFF